MNPGFPYYPPPIPQRSVDAEHLKQLVVVHYIMAGLTAVFSLIPIVHVLIGLSILIGAGPFGKLPASGGSANPAVVGWMFLGIGGFIILFGEAMALLTLIAARSIAARKHHTFCLVNAGLLCLHAPLGTVLGVFTFIVLLRPSVKAEFMAPEPQRLPYSGPAA